MNFTFGIITKGDNDNYIKEIIKSIEDNNIPQYEIIIVGNSQIANTTVIQVIPFCEETQVRDWITRKKNIIIENAKYENICFLHDYVKFNEGWYKGFIQFGNDFDWCVTKIMDINGNRFRDYTLFPHKVDYLDIHYSIGEDIHFYFAMNTLLPYDFINNIKINKYMYISGTYFIMKKNIAQTYKLNECLGHCMAEDVELSKRLHSNNIIIKCNKYSSVSFLKEKGRAYYENEISKEAMSYLIEWSNK